MSHMIEWDNDEKTVLLQQYTDKATKDDLYYLAKKSNQMLATVEHRVHIIIDERNIDLILNSADMRYLEHWTSPNQGAVVMVVQAEKANYKRLSQEHGRKIAPHAFADPHFVETIEEARQILMDMFAVEYGVAGG